MGLARVKIKALNDQVSLFSSLILILNFILILTFSTSNLILFYILFESSLIPTLSLILLWGYQPERLQAGIYLILYTISASLPLLFLIAFIYNKSSSLSIILPLPKFYLWNPHNFISLAAIIAFLVKIPLFITHLWLPKAHVEAPVAGSIVLAGILLKLGSYGILRLSLLCPPFSLSIQSPILAVSIWGGVATSIICLRQQDIKSLIAYSSVGHIALLIGGIFRANLWGWSAALAIMVAHGLSSSALFSLANIYYESSTSRSLTLTKGISFLFPAITTLWFLAAIANIAAPPTINLFREIMLITRILSSSISTSIPLALIRFLTAGYSLLLFTASHHGWPPSFFNNLSTSNHKNFSISILHLLPSFIIISFRFVVSLWI